MKLNIKFWYVIHLTKLCWYEIHTYIKAVPSSTVAVKILCN